MNNKAIHIRLILISGVLLILILLSLKFGAETLEIGNGLKNLLTDKPEQNTLSVSERIFILLRLPRVIMVVLTGAGISIASCALQTILRNPLIESGTLGISGGAALGASLSFFMIPVDILIYIPLATPLMALLGSFLASLIFLWFIPRQKMAYLSNTYILLSGITINAIFLSATGYLSYLARDPQARSITFWSLGMFSGSSWTSVTTYFPAFLIGCSTLFLQSKSINICSLGQEQARILGVSYQKKLYIVILANIILTSLSTAFTGIISFVGLITPQLFNLNRMPDIKHRFLFSGLTGACAMLLIDLISRMAIAPAEIPVGIISAFIGGPIFLYILRKYRYQIDSN